MGPSCSPACRWLQAEWRNLGEMDAPEVDPVLQQAAQALRARPALFTHCAEEVATARHSALFQRCAAAWREPHLPSLLCADSQGQKDAD